MAKDTGKGTRKGAVTARTQSKNPKTGDWTKRDETPGSAKKGQFMDVKSDAKNSKASRKSRISGGSSFSARVTQMDIQSVAYHLEFYTGGDQVEHYRTVVPFLCPRLGERVLLHHGSLTMDITRVVYNLVEHDGAHLEFIVQIYGDEVPALE